MRFIVIVWSLVLVVPALASETTKVDKTPATPNLVNHGHNYPLWAKCNRFALVVEGLSDGATEIDLTSERISTLAESRLRSARLYDAASRKEYLYVNVNVVGNAFNVSLEYKRWIEDIGHGEGAWASIWHVGGAGTHGSSDSYIMQIISEQIDEFILAYLEVNEQACEKPIGENAPKDVSTLFTDEVFASAIDIAFTFGEATASIIASSENKQADKPEVSSACLFTRRWIDNAIGPELKQQLTGDNEKNMYLLTAISSSNYKSKQSFEVNGVECDLLKDYYRAADPE